MKGAIGDSHTIVFFIVCEAIPFKNHYKSEANLWLIAENAPFSRHRKGISR
jgi:hypothetical protein